MIKVLVPEAPAIHQVFRRLQEMQWNNCFSNFGPLSQELEKEVASQHPEVENLRAVSCANATLALELALTLIAQRCHFLDEHPCRVLIPSLTFPATASAVLRAGMVPVFGDVDLNSWQMLPEHANALYEGDQREPHPFDIVMPVAAFGAPVDAMHWSYWSAVSGIPVLIDAAGAMPDQEAFAGVPMVYSMHATKAISSGEGGMLVTDDARLADEFRALTNFGRPLGLPAAEVTLHGGTNAKMSEYHAAVGLASWENRISALARRRQLSAHYAACLEALGVYGLQAQLRPPQGAYTLMPVLLPPGSNVKGVRTRLSSAGVETALWYLPPLHLHPVFSKYPGSSKLPNTDAIAARLIGLPMHLRMDNRIVDEVCLQILKALQ